MAIQQSSLNDVFRFVALRSLKSEKSSVRLINTPFAQKLATFKSVNTRRDFVNKIIRGGGKDFARSIEDLENGRVLKQALEECLMTSAATLQMFREKLDNPTELILSSSFSQDLQVVSDTLLAFYFSSIRAKASFGLFRRIFVVLNYLRESVADQLWLEQRLDHLFKKVVLPPFQLPETEAWKKPQATAVGLADLLVVKQHILRYEATEIAHVENIMSGETRTREHRSLERIEETLRVEKEKILEREKELETSERFELNKETSRTIKEDQKYAFDLSVSANYGPTVEVETGFNLDISVSTESTDKSSSKYAKDVVERSLERIKERVTEERIKTILRETEEKNLHSFINGDDRPQKSGIYQFLDKIYEAQVYNYGKRQMFDLMVPEPASYLWFLNRNESNSSRSLPEAPEPIGISAMDLRHLGADASHPYHYTKLAQKYGASGLTAPPDRFVVATAKFQNPSQGTAPASENGNLLTAPVTLEVTVPAGYRPVRGKFHAVTFADDGNTTIPFTAGSIAMRWIGAVVMTHGSLSIRQGSVDFEFPGSAVFTAESKLVIGAVPYETANYTLSVEITCEATSNHLASWKLETYDKIRSAYNDRLMEHKDELSKIKTELKQQENKVSPEFGIPPSKRKQLVLTELKKHCIAIFMNSWFERTASELTGEPPQFDFSQAHDKGVVIRFLEHAIEWSQIQYALYPYFWASKATWAERLAKDDADYEFQQFMQAGAARVVIPVRPKFEEAFNHFLETGEVWNGTGETPLINDPLYVSIVDEIRELSGGALDQPVPVGPPWEIRLPTSLVLLRDNSSLPSWRRESPEDWTWAPNE